MSVVRMFLEWALALPLASNAHVVRAAVFTQIAVDVSALGGNSFEIDGLKAGHWSEVKRQSLA